MQMSPRSRLANILPPDGSVTAVRLHADENSRLRQLQDLVGGPIEGVPLADGRYMLINENGKDDPKLINRMATDLAHANESITDADYIADLKRQRDTAAAVLADAKLPSGTGRNTT